MRLVTFVDRDQERLGALDKSGHIVDLHNAYALFLRQIEGQIDAGLLAPIHLGRDMREFLQRGEDSLHAAHRTLEFLDEQALSGGSELELFQSRILCEPAQVRLKSPLPRPGALVSAGKNFSDHVAEMSARQGPSHPVAFLKLPGTVIGPDDDIPYPKETQKLDYEVELAIVIGRPCLDVSPEQALDYVAGYAAFNDISARDVIRSENRHGIHLMGKSFPGFAPMGPCLVTRDEITEPQHLKLRLTVNGEVRQDSNLSYMIFKIREIIAYWSQMGLNPGDVLTTGTPRGVAAGRKEGQTPWWLKPGDVVEAEVENIGCLRNRITAP